MKKTVEKREEEERKDETLYIILYECCIVLEVREGER